MTMQATQPIIKSGRKKYAIEPGDYVISTWEGNFLENKDTRYRDPFKLTDEAMEAFKNLPGVVIEKTQSLTCTTVIKYRYSPEANG